MVLLAIPREVTWAYFALGTVLAIGLVVIFFAAIGKERRESTS